MAVTAALPAAPFVLLKRSVQWNSDYSKHQMGLGTFMVPEMCISQTWIWCEFLKFSQLHIWDKWEVTLGLIHSTKLRTCVCVCHAEKHVWEAGFSSASQANSCFPFSSSERKVISGNWNSGRWQGVWTSELWWISLPGTVQLSGCPEALKVPADISFGQLLWAWESGEPPAALTPPSLCVRTSRSIAGAAANSLDYHRRTCQDFFFSSFLDLQGLCSHPCAGSDSPSNSSLTVSRYITMSLGSSCDTDERRLFEGSQQNTFCSEEPLLFLEV